MINIEIGHSFTQMINVKAHGSGCSIVSELSIGNLVNFETYLSGGVVKRVTSSRTQNLIFLLESKTNFSSTQSKKEREANKNKVRSQDVESQQEMTGVSIWTFDCLASGQHGLQDHAQSGRALPE